MPRYISLVHTTGHIRLFSSALALWALGGGALAPLDGQERPRPAPPVVADSGPSEAWNAPVAHAIAARAIEARAHVYADTSLRAFEATAQGHVYFLAGFQGEREVVRADQIALDVRWQAPNRALQTIVGRRHEIRLPTNIRYHIDHLSLVLDNFGDRIQLGDGDEVWNVLHPAAPGAPEFYDYRLADSLEIRIRDRAVRVFELELRPRDAADPGAVGSMFVDRESGAIARLRVTFTAAAYRDPDLVRIVLDLRSALWEGRYWLPAEQDLEITRGAVNIKGVADRKVTLGELAKRLVSNVNVALPNGFTPGLEATAYHTPARPVYANGSNVAEVEVDIETGAVTLLDYRVAHDCGTLINPMLVDGQIVGGVVHGIGNALFERMVYDTDSGQPVTTNFGDYLLPTATEIPPIRLEHMESPSPANPLGVKGAGEGGTIPGIACIVSAIEDALQPLGVKLNEYPLSPERLLQLIDEKRSAK